MPTPRRNRATQPDLPKPDCKLGYTQQQVEAIMGPRSTDFHRWMRGQTVSLCEGTEWDYDSQTSKLTGCGPHGVIIYRSDVEQFLRGGGPLD